MKADGQGFGCPEAQAYPKWSNVTHAQLQPQYICCVLHANSLSHASNIAPAVRMLACVVERGYLLLLHDAGV
jgi:hypothetical protein